MPMLISTTKKSSFLRPKANPQGNLRLVPRQEWFPPPQERSEFLALEKQSRHASGGSLSRLDASCITAWGYEVGEAHGLLCGQPYLELFLFNSRSDCFLAVHGLDLVMEKLNIF